MRGRECAVSRRLALAGAAALFALPLSAASAGAQEARVPLPTETDAIALAFGSDTILYGPEGVETQLPGPVTDREVVDLQLGPDGNPVRIAMTQHLFIDGVGDFRFKVSGPVQNLEALPESEAEPGLRRGSIIWQGFSPGFKTLAAGFDLFPEDERRRLPLATRLSATVDGEPLDLEQPRSGPLELTFQVENVSAIPIQVADFEGNPPQLARVLEALHQTLSREERPSPGRGAIPDSLAARGPVESRQANIEAPFRIDGELLFPPGTLADARAEGGTVEVDDEGTHVRFSALLGGGDPLTTAVTVHGAATDLVAPALTMDARPAPPSPEVVGAPADALAGAEEDPRRTVSSILEVMWQTARLRQYDGYLGNPDPTGPAVTKYGYRLATVERAAGPSAPIAPSAPSPLAAPALALAALLVAANVVLLWSHS